jgi:tellurite resistance-related uncharacterized protein
MEPRPYRSTPVFDADSLPDGLRREHSTKAGVWGVIRMIEGALRLEFGDGTAEQVVTPGAPGLLLPEQPHLVTPLGAIRMQVDFYDVPPALSAKETNDEDRGRA